MPGAAHGGTVRVARYALRGLLFVAGAVVAYLLLSAFDRPAHADPGLPAPPQVPAVARLPDLSVPTPNLTVPVPPKSPPVKPPTPPVAPVVPPAPALPSHRQGCRWCRLQGRAARSKTGSKQGRAPLARQ